MRILGDDLEDTVCRMERIGWVEGRWQRSIENASIIFTILEILYLFQHLPMFYLKDELMVFKTLEISFTGCNIQ